MDGKCYVYIVLLVLTLIITLGALANSIISLTQANAIERSTVGISRSLQSNMTPYPTSIDESSMTPPQVSVEMTAVFERLPCQTS
jgi:hypothetical protein